jgi:hypothetical protein
VCQQLSLQVETEYVIKIPTPSVKTAQPLTQFSQATQSVSPAQSKKEFGFAFGEIGMSQSEQH